MTRTQLDAQRAMAGVAQSADACAPKRLHWCCTRRLAMKPYGPYTSNMARKTYGAEEARTLLPELIERAHRGERSVITKRGKPYAEVVPVGTTTDGKARLAFLSLAGTGRGLWGRDSRKVLKRLRDEWS